MKFDKLTSVIIDVGVALGLLTRLPLPKLPDRAFDAASRAVWAYGIVGIVVGACAAVMGGLTLLIGLPAVIAAGVVIGVLALCTGAMHEDGLSDTADGFWGGATTERRLEIMKDSQIGTYGALTLIVVTGVRWMGYASLLPHGLGFVLTTAVLSRAMMPIVMYALPHARDTGLSRSVGQPQFAFVLIGICAATLAAFAVTGLPVVPALVAAIGAVCVIIWLAKSKIGGQTGDVIGATQQITELSVLCTLTALIP